jgi:hypothetical protein
MNRIAEHRFLVVSWQGGTLSAEDESNLNLVRGFSEFRFRMSLPRIQDGFRLRAHAAVQTA